MKRKSTQFGLVVVTCLVPLGFAAAQGSPDAWYGRQAKPKNMGSPTVFKDTFSIELPDNWQFAPGHRGTVFLKVEKTGKNDVGALIALEYMRLQAPLDPAVIPAASDVELKDVQAREASGRGFTAEVKTGSFGQFIVIHYNRPGLAGKDYHVVQYSIPIGTTMYRLICIAPTSTLEKYRPLFAHVAASFTPAKASGT